nr:MAG TPA: hypothetical protein [Caudoviricetes sp.]
MSPYSVYLYSYYTAFTTFSNTVYYLLTLSISGKKIAGFLPGWFVSTFIFPLPPMPRQSHPGLFSFLC